MTPSQITNELRAIERWLAGEAATTRYRYNSPLILLSLSRLGFTVTVWLDDIRREETGLSTFEGAVAAARQVAKSIAAQIDDTALARTLGVEMAHA